MRYRKGPPVEAGGTTPRGDQFTDIREFKQLLLKERELIARCLTEKLMTYALGRKLGFSDRSAIRQIIASTREEGHGLRSLVHGIVQSDQFRNP